MPEVDLFTELSSHLLAAGQVRSAPVYNITLEQVAFGEELSLDRTTGRPVYAVEKTGGHSGVGCQYCSLPWEKFSYNTKLEGFISDIVHDTLKGGALGRTY